MIVAFDTGMLSILIHPHATLPDDPSTNKPLDLAKERIEHLVNIIEERNGRIIIPTPALSEFLVVVDEAGSHYLRVLYTHALISSHSTNGQPSNVPNLNAWHLPRVIRSQVPRDRTQKAKSTARSYP
jgi:hypothetical protein